jgi:hypothetical protein
MDQDILKVEKQFIHILLNNKQMVEDWINSSLKIEHFNTEHHLILTAISDAYNCDTILTRKTFNSLLEKTKSPKERVEQEQSFNKCLISKADKNDFPILLNQISESFILRTTTENIKRFNISREKNGNTFALKELLSGLQELETEASTKDKVLYSDMADISKELLQNIREVRKGNSPKIKKILTGIKEIDQTMMTGLSPGTFSLVCSDVGGYKSSIMLNIALNCWKLGNNVLFVPIEMPKDQMWDRAIARESGVPTEHIINPEQMTDEEMKLLEQADKAWCNGESKFYMFRMPESTTVFSIKRYIDKYIDIFKPSLIVIDYMDNLDSDNNKFKDRHDLEIHEMILGLRKAGESRGFGILSGAQLGREALKRIRKSGSSKEKTSVNSEDIRGAHSFAMAADYIWAQVPNPQQPTTLLDIFVVKARNGKKVFPNATMKATLEIVPEIGLIRSQQEFNIENNPELDKMFEAHEDDEVIVDKKKLQAEQEDTFLSDIEVSPVNNSSKISSSISSDFENF